MPTPPEIDRLENARAVTASYTDFKGLYLVIIGLLLGTMAFLVRDGNLEPLILGLPVFVVLGLLVRAYYRRRFGDVRPLQTPQRIAARTFLPVLALVAFFTAIAVANNLGVNGVWLFIAFMVGVFLMMVGSPWRKRIHYLVSAAVLAVLFLAPLGMLTPSGVHPFEWEYPNLAQVTVAVLFVVNGLLDHRTLVRTLTPVSENGTD
ncbi:hypothetical protein H4W79_000893 [Nocardiopsis terrae]|uniref:Uncharacterized protein n=1 Tax=Nocardiopsis terrae TaxID=372655 RepID=A0ABR9HCB8_9ACTN|nr:hypothetical protein [Nocardiopsis terrae]MBE1456679.1 hypothetical protein [Nocardiopsis terrae]